MNETQLAQSMSERLLRQYQEEMEIRIAQGQSITPLQDWARAQLDSIQGPSYRERQAEMINRQFGKSRSSRMFGVSQATYNQWNSEYEGRFNDPGPPPPPPRTEQETKTAFQRLMLDAGLGRITLPIKERVEHEMQLGEPEEFKKKRVEEKQEPDKPKLKRLCPICADPRCPWSD